MRPLDEGDSLVNPRPARHRQLTTVAKANYPDNSVDLLQGRSLVVSSLPGNPPWLPDHADSAYLAVIDGQQN